MWLSPEMFEQTREKTLAYLVQAAAAAEPLQEQFPGRLVFCVGTESSLFTRDTWSSARWTRYRWRCTGYRSRARSCAPG